jgi:hypothetical protein
MTGVRAVCVLAIVGLIAIAGTGFDMIARVIELTGEAGES